MRFDTLVRQADKVMMYKYIAKNSPFRMAIPSPFMPKTALPGQRSGMHVHQVPVEGDVNNFFDAKGYGQWSVNVQVLHRRSALPLPFPVSIYARRH